MLPIHRDGVFLGNQRFNLAASDIGFKITCMNSNSSPYRSQLAKAIKFSQLRAIHWINIAHEEVTLTTVH